MKLQVKPVKIKIAFYSGCILLLLVMQTTFPEYAMFMGVKPNLILVFTICAALVNGSVTGAFAGAFAGLALDLLSGKIIGINALFGMYAGVAAGLINKRIFRNNIFVLLLSVFTSTVVYEGLMFLLNFFFKNGLSSYTFGPILRTVLPEALYNCIVSLVMFRIVFAVSNKFEAKLGIQK